MTDSLPVRECLDEIVEAVRQTVPVVLKAPPGAGKTTCVPPAIIDQGGLAEGQLLLVQPRRLAARAAASRIASLRGTRVGDEVGYQVRFDKRVSSHTRLVCVTTGVLLRRLVSDPLLDGIDCVVLDEFHERSLEVDLALGMLQRIRTTLRPELKVVVMSATLDPQPIVEFFGDAKAVSSEGRAFPVEVRYQDIDPQQRIEDRIASVLPEMMRATAGDVLVFLPGVGEIRRTGGSIVSVAAKHDCDVFELYGDLSPRDQDAVLEDSNRRKIILATNVAETSITIPGVTGVIDSGLARVMRFDTHVGLPKLQLEPISQASAEQRTGRAGRTQPGICVRLWSRAMQRSRRELDVPEVQRSDFSQSLLTLAAWGERDPMAFPWLTPPSADAVSRANHLLLRLGAIDDQGGLTGQGQQMILLPMHPRLARFVVEAVKLGITDDAALVAAMLSERDPFRERPPAEDRSAASNRCDVADRLERMRRFSSGNASGVPNIPAAKQVLRAAEQIRRIARRIDPAESQGTDSQSPPDATSGSSLGRALLAAYPDRLARRRSSGDPRGVMVGGRGVRIDGRSNVRDGDLFLCIDVDSKGTEATVRMASTVELSWLDSRLISTIDEPFYNPTLKAVVARRRCYFDDLRLSESPIECKPGGQVALLLASHARANFGQCMSDKDHAISGFIQRVRFLTDQMPELDLPPLDDQAIDDVLVELCQTRTTMQELQQAPWFQHLSGRYDYSQSQWIDQHAPARITVPSGNSMAIAYAAGKPPVMKVRIQELFGWSSTPRLAGGKVPLQLHLLGPNHRPQQVTDDLQNFWKETYQVVRKELRRRYPKHHWPEDPANATATRNGLKPRA